VPTLGTAKLVAFAATTDGARARAFYEGLLGLSVVSDDDFALVLSAGGTGLRIHKVRELSPQPFTALGFQVEDIETIATELASRGVHFERYRGMAQDELGIWRAPSGARIAWFMDPDDNTLSLTQPARAEA